MFNGNRGCNYYRSFGEHPGDHNHQDPKSLRYKREAYCDTNGRRTAIQRGEVLTVSPFSQSQPRGTKSIAVQIGGVLQYKLEVYCDTFLRSSGGWAADIITQVFS